MTATRKRKITFEPVTIECVGDEIKPDIIQSETKAVPDLVEGDQVSVSNLKILKIEEEGVLDPKDMAIYPSEPPKAPQGHTGPQFHKVEPL